MNKYAFFTIALVLLLSFAGWLWLHPSGESSDPADKEFERAMTLIERACLSQVSEEKRVKFLADLKAVAGSLKAEGSIGSENEAARGASRDLQDELQLQENESIRACIEQYFPKLMERILGMVPNPLEFRFDFAVGNPGSAGVGADVITLRLHSDHTVIPGENLARQASGYFVTRLAYPELGERYTGIVTPTVQDEVHNLAVAKSTICFERPDPLPHFTQQYAYFSCRAGTPCALKEYTPEWVLSCAMDTASRLRTGISLIRWAAAQDAPDFWTIPSIRTWSQRQDTLIGIGLTRFEVQTDAFRDSGAIGVEAGLWVNGTPVYVDGLTPGERPEAYDGKGPFTWEFGLRSVDLQGLHAGCDELRVQLTPLLAGGHRGEAIEARRMYVSLRDARPDELLQGSGPLRWEGHYVEPSEAYEKEVFMMSILYDGGEDWQRFSENTPALKDARTTIAREKQRFDALRLKFEGQTVVAVIRPPLTKPSFYLAAGVVRPSGQVHFTFTTQEANALRKFLLDARERSDQIRNLVRQDTFIYTIASNTERREHQTPPGVCKGVV